jgi:micrococcal nuclease
VKVRLKDIDTPETLHPHCEEELKKGLQAKARLRELLRGQLVTVMHSGETDRYRRSLGWLTLQDRTDAGSVLVKEGLALSWQGGSTAKASRIAHWCGAHR